VVVALAFTLVSVQFKIEEAAELTTGVIVFCVTTCEPLVEQPLDAFVTV
jgi:hypothetical protein